MREDSPIRAITEVDRAGIRVAVGQGSAYDLFLSRELKAAEIVRAPNPPAVVPLFINEGLEVAAGVRQQLEIDMRRHPGLRLFPERFMLIRQAMGLARQRGEAAHVALAAFVEAMKDSDFIADALVRHGIDGARLAPKAV